MSKCLLCPRECGAERAAGEIGFCGVTDEYYVAKTMLHNWEEPCISGKGGAGTVFFSGCNLHCVYCQNRDISGGITGKKMSDGELEKAIFELFDNGAECIEFVTPTHYTDRLARLLAKIKPNLSVPVVWNSGGYEKVEALKLLDGLVDVYLPDFKYYDSEIAKQYSSAPDYKEIALVALEEMLRQVGKTEFDEMGMMKKGVIVRHLVLPSHRKDSINILQLLSEHFGTDSFMLSLMSQYTPDFYIESECANDFKCLCRRVTEFEYESVANVARELGFDGYFQDRRAASRSYTPDFSQK